MLLQLTDTVCLPNKQAVFQINSIFSIFLTLELEIVMYLMVQSCLHVVINFPRLPKPNQNMPYFSLSHPPLQNSAKFCGNVEILWKRANSAARLKIPLTAKTVVPNKNIGLLVNLAMTELQQKMCVVCTCFIVGICWSVLFLKTKI